MTRLESIIKEINIVAGEKPKGWSVDSKGTYRANVGTYVIHEAYGAVGLHRMANESGAITEVIPLRAYRGAALKFNGFLNGLKDIICSYCDESKPESSRWHGRICDSCTKEMES